jgi:hypothetical protein
MKFLVFVLLLALMHGAIYFGQKVFTLYRRLADHGFLVLLKRMLKG